MHSAVECHHLSDLIIVQSEHRFDDANLETRPSYEQTASGSLLWGLPPTTTGLSPPLRSSPGNGPGTGVIKDQLVNGLACGRAGGLRKKGRTMVSII